MISKKKAIQSIDFSQGTLEERDKIAPAYINLNNPKYMEIDNMFYSGLIVVNYEREINDLILRKLIESNINMNISMFYEKQETFKTIRDLTYHIGNASVDLKDHKENRQNVEIVSFSYQDAKYIRKELQINNEELYFIYTYINIFAEDTKELEYYHNKIESLLQSVGLQTRKANFRQEQVFLSCLPLAQNHAQIKKAACRNVLTKGLTGTYPFISSSIFDENGIFVGTNMFNNSLVFIDRYDSNKYKNANMCVFGTSGSRKIFLYKANDFAISFKRNRTICD